ncbi:MAG: NADP oxidoreductase [Candidatus Omnitrophica bacterium]|nr:NADP oxidoreductase [Candidatus Omnitrophota bacterium]
MSKKKVATIWLAGCSGCHMSLLDIDERIFDVAKLADIVKSPVVDTKEFPDCDIALIEGAIASEEHLEDIKHIRAHTKILVSMGDCAVTGNVSALRNMIPLNDVLLRAYVEAPSNVDGKIPEAGKGVSRLLPRVMPLHEAVKIDFFIPGCPPSADLLFYCLFELLNDRIPVVEKFKLG